MYRIHLRLIPIVEYHGAKMLDIKWLLSVKSLVRTAEESASRMTSDALSNLLYYIVHSTERHDIAISTLLMIVLVLDISDLQKITIEGLHPQKFPGQLVVLQIPHYRIKPK